MRAASPPRFGREEGQSLVEFAVSVPVLLLLLVGLVDFGHGFQNYVALGNAVREAAREAAVHGYASSAPWGPAADDANVKTAVRARAAGLVAQNITVTSSWPDGHNQQGGRLVVSATYTFVPAASAFLGNVTVPLSATTTTKVQH